MKLLNKMILILVLPNLLTGCLVTSVVGGAVSAVKTTVSTAIDVVDTITPDITD